MKTSDLGVFNYFLNFIILKIFLAIMFKKKNQINYEAKYPINSNVKAQK
jgi:hypothetical protein